MGIAGLAFLLILEMMVELFERRLTKLLLFFLVFAQVVSTFITLALLGGAAYLYFRSSSSNDSSGGSGGGSKGRGDDLDDPLADARRIMDKYK